MNTRNALQRAFQEYEDSFGLGAQGFVCWVAAQLAVPLGSDAKVMAKLFHDLGNVYELGFVNLPHERLWVTCDDERPVEAGLLAIKRFHIAPGTQTVTVWLGQDLGPKALETEERKQ